MGIPNHITGIISSKEIRSVLYQDAIRTYLSSHEMTAANLATDTPLNSRVARSRKVRAEEHTSAIAIPTIIYISYKA